MAETEKVFSKIKNLEIGRILRASTVGFTIGSRVGQLSAPSFGSLVKAQPLEQRETIYGLIYDMHIDDDPLVRRLVLAENPPQAVIEDQRHNRLLPIEMSVLAIGYRRDGGLYYGLPPRPPLNLDPVYLCQDLDEVSEFSEQPGYFRLILRAAAERVPVDQLMIAHIQNTFELRGHDLVWARRILQELTDLMRYDYDLLVPILEALSQSLPELGAGPGQ
jgi:hypothetical protein